MSYLPDHWSFDPFVILAVAVVVWHEIGLRRLARRSRPERTGSAGSGPCGSTQGCWCCCSRLRSPIDYWADYYFFVHMIQHLLLMFAAPSLIVAGAPWQPLLRRVCPGTARAAALPVACWRAAGPRPLRAVGGFFLRPWVAVGLFSLVMIVWHLPGP